MRLFGLLLIASTLLGCGGSDDKDTNNTSETKTYYFSAIPDQGSTELAEKFDKIADYLGKELGVTIKYRAASDYGAAVEMFKNGDIQFAWFGGLTGCQARAAVSGARAIAQGDSDPNYLSYFIAHKDTGLTKSDEFPEGLADLTFAFGSEKSTSGRLMPEYFIRQNTGKGPKEFFKKQYLFSGSHPKTAEMVSSGQVQAGALNYKVFDKMVKQGKIDPEVVRIVWITPGYADYNWTVHPDLGDAMIAKLQKALLGLSGDLLTVFPRNSMIPAKNEDFESIAVVAKQLGLMR